MGLNELQWITVSRPGIGSGGGSDCWGTRLKSEEFSLSPSVGKNMEGILVS